MSSSHKPDVTLSLSLTTSSTPNPALKPQERSLKLIQLLLTCANHVSSGNLQRADACLGQISQLASVTGDPIQRLSARFASALAARLLKRWPGLYKALNNDTLIICDPSDARPIFYKVFPFLGFAYSVINRTLIQALCEDRAIHVVDLGSNDPKLWAPFIRGIANGPIGPPHLKITSVSKDVKAQERLGTELVKEAESSNVPFEFNPVNSSLRDLTLDMLQVKPGDAVALTSILGLHVLLAEDDRVDARFGLSKKNEVRECKEMNRFLEMAKSLRPKVMFLVEQESNYNSSRLVDRFIEGLNFYSALFDCIDVAFGGFSCGDRTALEEMFGKEIENIVAGEGLEREERHERYAMWATRFSRVGFRPIRLWHDCLEEAQQVVEHYGLIGCKIINQKGCLMLCWHDRPIYAVSAWCCFC